MKIYKWKGWSHRVTKSGSKVWNRKRRLIYRGKTISQRSAIKVQVAFDGGMYEDIKKVSDICRGYPPIARPEETFENGECE